MERHAFVNDVTEPLARGNIIFVQGGGYDAHDRAALLFFALSATATTDNISKAHYFYEIKNEILLLLIINK